MIPFMSKVELITFYSLKIVVISCLRTYNLKFSCTVSGSAVYTADIETK